MSAVLGFDLSLSRNTNTAFPRKFQLFLVLQAAIAVLDPFDVEQLLATRTDLTLAGRPG
jgi:hypothetical protein